MKNKSKEFSMKNRLKEILDNKNILGVGVVDPNNAPVNYREYCEASE